MKKIFRTVFMYRNGSMVKPIQFRKEYYFDPLPVETSYVFPNNLGVAKVYEHVFYEERCELLTNILFLDSADITYEENEVPRIKLEMIKLGWVEVNE